MMTRLLFPELSSLSNAMANPSNNANDVFDVRRIRRLVELMQENDLTELDIQQGDMRIQLKRGGTPIVPPAPVVSAVVPPPSFPHFPSAPVAEEKDVHYVTSPMVGTFFVAARPDVPPFVKVGDTVSPEKTICMIEAMKVFNEIPAECNGKIVAILAKNGESVEYGKPLFKVNLD